MFSPLDFSSPAPVHDEDMFTFAASTPRNPGRSRSEERVLTSAHPNGSFTSGQDGLWRAETSPDIYSQAADGPTQGGSQRIYRPRTMAVPSSSQYQQHQRHVARNGAGGYGGGGGGGGGGGVVPRGRPLVRQPPPPPPAPRQSPRYTIVYSVRGRSSETIVHPEVSRRPPPAPSNPANFSFSGNGNGNAGTQSRGSSKMRYIRNRSRSREAHNNSTLSPADRDLLQAVQSGVEKRQRAVRLSMYQVPDDGDDDWRIW